MDNDEIGEAVLVTTTSDSAHVAQWFEAHSQPGDEPTRLTDAQKEAYAKLCEANTTNFTESEAAHPIHFFEQRDAL